MYIYARKIFLVDTSQLRMQCSGTRIKFSQVVYLLRFSYLVEKKCFLLEVALNSTRN